MIEFIDHTGHTYSLPSYKTHPVGYEYQTTPYIHEFTSESNSIKLSTGNYYVLPVRMCLSSTMVQSFIDISLDSNVFRLVGGQLVQDRIEESGDLIFEIDDDMLKSELHIDDILKIESDDESIYIFYIIAYSDEPAAWSTNIMIKIWGPDEHSDVIEEYVPMTVRADFYGVREELAINGHNLGITLPEDIMKAVWQESFYNEGFNAELYNEKLKEYIVNYMQLYVEKGNIEQAQSSLKWFGWGNRLSLVKLLKTDNKILGQYIRDYIGIYNDNMLRQSHFLGTGLLSVFMQEMLDTGKTSPQHWNLDEKSFIGEGKPILENVFDKMVSVMYDEDEESPQITYVKPLIQYGFVELGLKLSCLRAFYEKEFLPVHSALQSVALQHQTWMNDIKFYSRVFEKISEQPFLNAQKRGTLSVKFPSDHTLYAYIQQAYVDEDMNEMSWYKPSREDGRGDKIDTNVLYIDDLFARIPVKIESDIEDAFTCVLLVEREGKQIWESHFSWCKKDGREWESFVLFPRLINSKRDMHYWLDKDYRVSLLVNGYWHEYEFTLKAPEFIMTLGKLEYKYNETLHRQLRCIRHNEETGEDEPDFESFMYLPHLVDVRNINFFRDLIDFQKPDSGQYEYKLMAKFIDMYREYPSLPFTMSSKTGNKYLNQVHMMKIYDGNGNELTYDSDASSVELYRKIFNDDGTQIQHIEANGLSYDIYLMHDSVLPEDYTGILTEEQFEAMTPRWYIVLISRETVDNALADSVVVPDVSISGWNLKLIGSDKKWLINRMAFVDKTDHPVFNTDDIIAGSLTGIKMPFILTEGTHWELRPFSLGMNKNATVSSSTNAFLMSIGSDAYANERGYYNIVARYSADGSLQYQKELKLRILVV